MGLPTGGSRLVDVARGTAATEACLHDRFTIGLVCSVGIGTGRGGRALNEDNYLVCRDGEARYRDGMNERVERFDGGGVLVAVADGMGGHDGGEVASAAAVRALSHLYRAGLPRAPESALRNFVLNAHARLYAKATARASRNMGTTLTTAWVIDGVAHWAQVGDSRLYHLHGERLTRVTSDHTRAEFARRDGRPPPRDPTALCQGFVFGSRGLGDDTAIRLDPGRDTGSLVLGEDDRLLLCSDGLSGFLSDDDIAEHLLDLPEPATCAVRLVEAAMAGGSDDNVTALIVRVDALGRRKDIESAPALGDITTLVPFDE